MKILFVHMCLCVRTIKFIYALKSKGHDIYVAYGAPDTTQTPWKKELINLLSPDHVFYFNDRKSLEELLEKVRDKNFNIVQCANEPNWPAAIAIKCKIAPVIFDCHDMTTMRISNIEDKDEEIVFKQSNGIIFTGERVKEYAFQKYNMDVPVIVCYSYMSQALIQERKNRISDGALHLVYEGGIMLRPSSVHYRYYIPLFLQIANQKIHVHIYPSRKPERERPIVKDIDNNPFLHLYDPLPYKQLLYELSQYHYGFVGFTFDDIPEEQKLFLNATSPNKLFDYLSAGVPSIVYNMQTSSEIVKKYDIGFTCKNIKNLHKQIEKCNKICIDQEVFKSLTMEANIEKVEDFYRDIWIKELECQYYEIFPDNVSTVDDKVSIDSESSINEISIKKDQPKVSIILPTYNRASFLREALESLKNQSYTNFEIIIVDDGSTDNTEDVVAEFPSNFKYFYKEHSGCINSLRYGLKKSTGVYICPFADDALMLPDGIRDRVEFMLSNSLLDMIYADAVIWEDEKFRDYEYPFYENPNVFVTTLCTSNFINGGTVMMKKSVLEAVGGWSELEMDTAEDYDLWMKIVTSGYRIGHLSKKVFILRIHPYNKSVIMSTTLPERATFISALRSKYLCEWRKLFKERRFDLFEGLKIAFYTTEGSRYSIAFCQEIIENLQYKGVQIRYATKMDDELNKWADLIWSEVCDMTTIALSKITEKPPTICRLHAREMDNVSLMRSVNWDNIDCLLFVSPYIQEETNKRYDISCRQKLIYNYINIDEFRFNSNKEFNYNIGMLGRVGKNKGQLRFIISIFRHLNPKWRLYLKGEEIKKTPCYTDILEVIEKYDLGDRIIFDDVFSDPLKWFNNIDVIISNSWSEGSHVAIAEGMSSGCFPVIKNWKGSELLYPKENIVSNDTEAIDLIEKWGNLADIKRKEILLEGRQYIVDRYNCRKILSQIDSLIVDLLQRRKND